MNRIDIVYGGRPYSLCGRSVESLRSEIAVAVVAGVPYWLNVNSGAGRFEDAYLLITPGVAVVVVNVSPNGGDDDDNNENQNETDDDSDRSYDDSL